MGCLPVEEDRQLTLLCGLFTSRTGITERLAVGGHSQGHLGFQVVFSVLQVTEAVLPVLLCRFGVACTHTTGTLRPDEVTVFYFSGAFSLDGQDTHHQEQEC